MWKPPPIEWERRISTTVEDVLIPKSPCDYIISGFQVLDRNFLIFLNDWYDNNPPPKKKSSNFFRKLWENDKNETISFKTSDLDTCTCVTKSYFKNIPKIFAKITISTTECIFCVLKTIVLTTRPFLHELSPFHNSLRLSHW